MIKQTAQHGNVES